MSLNDGKATPKQRGGQSVRCNNFAIFFFEAGRGFFLYCFIQHFKKKKGNVPNFDDSSLFFFFFICCFSFGLQTGKSSNSITYKDNSSHVGKKEISITFVSLSAISL